MRSQSLMWLQNKLLAEEDCCIGICGQSCQLIGSTEATAVLTVYIHGRRMTALWLDELSSFLKDLFCRWRQVFGLLHRQLLCLAPAKEQCRNSLSQAPTASCDALESACAWTECRPLRQERYDQTATTCVKDGKGHEGLRPGT